MKTNKFWVVALAVLALICTASMLVLRHAPASTAEVYLDGELIETLDLAAVTEPYTITVESTASDYNVISVASGRVCISNASCPDKLCVRQGWASAANTPIVCLPHKLVITLKSGNTPEVDAIVG